MYPDYVSKEFPDILNKYEFMSYKNDKKRNYLYQEPNQMLLRNYLSLHTPYENVLLYHGVGVGKCMKKDTPILMYTGDIKKVQDVQIDDLLMGDDSTPRSVLSLARGFDNMYDIVSVNNGEKYTVNEAHILCLIAPSLPSISHKKSTHTVTWLQDNKFYSKTFFCKTMAQKLLYSIKHDQILEISVKHFLKLPKRKQKLLKGYKTFINFTEQPSATPIDPYYFGQNMNLQSLIPLIYKCSSTFNRLKLIAGVLDAHGGTTNNAFFINFKDLDFNDDIIFLTRSLGLGCSKSLKHHENRLVIFGQGIGDIPTKNHQINKTSKTSRSVLYTNIAVKYVGKNDYYGFTLNNNCRYVLGDFTVTHNTCTSISIAEGFKEYLSNIGRKIIVIVKNKNIQQNFVNELLSACTQDEYINDARREVIKSIPVSKADYTRRKDVINSAIRNINKQYQFITYGTFVNRILGSKEFEKDDIGRNTNKVVKVDGQIKRKKASNPIKNLNNCVVIVDEAHNVTNNDVYVALQTILQKSFNYKLILLTATPMYDNPKEIFEISNLLNLNSPEYQLPIRNDLFKPFRDNLPLAIKEQSPYVNGNVLKGGIIKITEKGMNLLSNALLGKISYIKPNVETNPDVIVQGKPLLKNRIGSSNVVYCQMSSYQYKVYLQALSLDVKQDSKYDISAIQNIFANENIKESANVSRTSSLFKHSSDASTIVYPNNSFGKEGYINSSLKEVLNIENLQKYSSKLYKLLQNVNNSPGNTFIFSNYVSFGGTSLLRELFLNNGYKDYKSRQTEEEHFKSFIIFDDSTNPETREKYRRIFNSPENKNGKLVKIIIGSPIISEGITLKNVRQVHILEPSWNMSRINQIIGRAVRNFSHKDLEPSQKNVHIFKYVSVYVHPQQPKDSFFIDREKYILSEEKDRSNKIVERMLKEISFDCQFNQARNINVSTSLDNTAECDYTTCSFDCKIHNKSDKIDYSTYNLYLSSFDKFDIDYVLKTLEFLFKSYFIWHINDIVSQISKLEPNISTQAIYKTLGYIVGNKTSFVDMHGREGFIINKGPFYIFNPINVDINSSMYSKMLDFSIETNKYTLDDFYKFMFNEDLKSSKNLPQQPLEKNVKTSLSAKDKEFNDNLIASKLIFGTYRQRGSKENPYGPPDDKFRLVDMRKQTNETNFDDKRKNISGMWIGSFKKPELAQIATDLKIETKRPLSDYDKSQLGTLIETFLRKNNMILK